MAFALALENPSADETALALALGLALENPSADETALTLALEKPSAHETASAGASARALAHYSTVLVLVLVFFVRQANSDKHSQKGTHSQEYDPNV